MTYTVDKSKRAPATNRPNIDRGVPMPRTSKAGRPIKWPLDEMAPGDSIRIPWIEGMRSSVKATAWQRFGKKRTWHSRRVHEDGKEWFRVWRVT